MADKQADTRGDELVCVEVVELMTDYLEGVLPAIEARRLERHLDTCPGCTEYLRQLRTIAGSLRGLTEASFPVEIRDGLISDFERLRTPLPRTALASRSTAGALARTRRAIETVLKDRSYRDRARTIAAEMTAQPTGEAVLPRLLGAVR